MKFAYGDVRGAKGHVVLYDAAETLKAAELAQSDDIAPVDVEQLKTISHNSTPGEKKKTPPEPRHTPEGLEHLAEGRNNFLNEGVFLDARTGCSHPSAKPRGVVLPSLQVFSVRTWTRPYGLPPKRETRQNFLSV